MRCGTNGVPSEVSRYAPGHVAWLEVRLQRNQRILVKWTASYVNNHLKYDQLSPAGIAEVEIARLLTKKPIADAMIVMGITSAKSRTPKLICFRPRTL